MNNKSVIVRQVWAENLEYEFSLIKRAIPRFSFVSMDTEFPGTVFQSNLCKGLLFHAPSSYHYNLMKDNVDVLRIIQLGLTLSDSHGNLPSFDTPSCYIWQFNFRDFDIDRDPHNIESIVLLEQQGIDFKKNKEKGIDSLKFSMLVQDSDLILNRTTLTWIAFHGAYDFGFLIKILTQSELPGDINSFMWLIGYFFGVQVYDMKFIMRSMSHLHGGLERVSKFLGVDRIVGNRHEAGSDSLLTMQTFMKFNDIYVNFDLEHLNRNCTGYEGMLYGLYIPDEETKLKLLHKV